MLDEQYKLRRRNLHKGEQDEAINISTMPWVDMTESAFVTSASNLIEFNEITLIFHIILNIYLESSSVDNIFL